MLLATRMLSQNGALVQSELIHSVLLMSSEINNTADNMLSIRETISAAASDHNSDGGKFSGQIKGYRGVVG